MKRLPIGTTFTFTDSIEILEIIGYNKEFYSVRTVEKPFKNSFVKYSSENDFINIILPSGYLSNRLKIPPFKTGQRVYFNYDNTDLSGIVKSIDLENMDADVLDDNNHSYCLPFESLSEIKPTSYFNPDPFHLSTDISDLASLIEQQVRMENYRMVADLLTVMTIKSNRLIKRMEELK